MLKRRLRVLPIVSAALLAHLETPGLEVVDLFREVRDAVLKSTGDKQEPFMYGSLSREKIYLTARAEPDRAPDGQISERLHAEELATERVFWKSIKDSTNPADVEAYLSRYPRGSFVVLARLKLDALHRRQYRRGHNRRPL